MIGAPVPRWISRTPGLNDCSCPERVMPPSGKMQTSSPFCSAARAVSMASRAALGVLRIGIAAHDSCTGRASTNWSSRPPSIDHPHRPRRGGEEQQAVEPGDVIGHQERAALLGQVLALIEADAVDGVGDEPGQELDRGLRDQEDDVDEDGNRRQSAEQEDLVADVELDADWRARGAASSRRRRSACRRR